MLSNISYRFLVTVALLNILSCSLIVLSYFGASSNIFWSLYKLLGLVYSFESFLPSFGGFLESFGGFL